VLASLVVLFWPWGAFLIWPVVSLGTAAAAYFRLGPGIFQKREGRLPWTTWFALGPVLLGQTISRAYYRRQARAWDELTPQLWIGRVLSGKEAAEAVRQGVTAVLDLTAEFSEPAAFRAITYKNIPILDLTAPTIGQLQEAAAFIEEQSKSGIVYLHCKIGYSRTAAAAAAYLLWIGAVRTVSEAIDLLRKVRPPIVLRSQILAALNEFDRVISHVVIPSGA